MGEAWAPGSYVGLPAAYGALWSLVGPVLLLWLTPLLGALGVWLMYLLVRRWQGPRVGLAAAALLAVTPAYWHASVQPFTPAIPFVILLMAAALGLTGRRWFSWLLGGLALGVGLAIRPHETIWVLPLAVVAFAGRASWRLAAVAALGAAIPFAAAAYLQLQTYGSILGSGYSLASAGDGGPFSFSIRSVAQNLWFYVASLHGYMLGLAAAGAALAWRGRTMGRRYPWVLALAAAGWLLIYGSYVVHDSPGLAEPTIGNSQVRYLLPMLVLLVPAAASLAARVSGKVTFAALAIAALLGYGSVVAAPGDGTLAVQRTLEANRRVQNVVLMLTDNETLVVAGRLDKLFVGHRPTAFAAGTDLADRLREGKHAVMVGGQGVPEGVKVGRRADLAGGLVVQELLAE